MPWHLKAGPLRHRQLTEAVIGVTPKVLAERLSTLDDAALVSRHPGLGFLRTTTCALTARGMSLVELLDALELWTKAGSQYEAII
ncbi:winged helix-turn-helix transcriptional regulator [Microvirga roseola]|uniref:winged helix-turn-helix transcriptional regulator n=1 Tax=Microvirga roseola TaxID=2883126 RepID=UPI003899276B